MVEYVACGSSSGAMGDVIEPYIVPFAPQAPQKAKFITRNSKLFVNFVVGIPN